MNCEACRQQSSLMMDVESGDPEQAGLFTHLGGCAECRHFFDSLIRLRSAVRRDRDDLLRQADEMLPARPPLPAAAAARRSPAGWRSWWWRTGLPAPAAIAFAVLLLAAGIAIGAGLAARPGRRPQGVPDAEPGKLPAGGISYVYVCSMPQIEVIGRPAAASGE
jgi:predicted anti-sigma-YlaC factor YlaD